MAIGIEGITLEDVYRRLPNGLQQRVYGLHNLRKDDDLGRALLQESADLAVLSSIDTGDFLVNFYHTQRNTAFREVDGQSRAIDAAWKTVSKYIEQTTEFRLRRISVTSDDVSRLVSKEAA